MARIRNPFYAHTFGQRQSLPWGGFNPQATSARKPSAGSGLPRPPAGTYDPSIDASERAAVRGYHDLKSDTATANTRASTDYASQLQDIGRTRDYGLADLLTQQDRGNQDIGTQRDQVNQSYGRSLADLLTARDRGAQDYQSNVAALDRNYRNLGAQQAQAASAGGAANSGALLQALQKRTSNEAIDRQPLDTGYQRFMADSQTQQSRLGQDQATALSALDTQQSRLGQDVGTQRSRLTTQYGAGGTDYGLEGQKVSLGFQRGNEDRATALARGGRELNAYKQDLVPVRYYSAAGLSPWTPPRRRKP